jgi:hypothetical protein
MLGKKKKYKLINPAKQDNSGSGDMHTPLCALVYLRRTRDSLAWHTALQVPRLGHCSHRLGALHLGDRDRPSGRYISGQASQALRRHEVERRHKAQGLLGVSWIWCRTSRCVVYLRECARAAVSAPLLFSPNETYLF